MWERESRLFRPLNDTSRIAPTGTKRIRAYRSRLPVQAGIFGIIGIVIPRQKRSPRKTPQIIAELKDCPSDADGTRTRNHGIDDSVLLGTMRLDLLMAQTMFLQHPAELPRDVTAPVVRPDPRNLPATSQIVSLYLCPSTSLFEAHRSESSHLMNLGDIPGVGMGPIPGEGMACLAYLGISGPDKNAKNPSSGEKYGRQRGILIGIKGFPNSDQLTDPPTIRAKHVTDGLSNTTWLTECTGRGADEKKDRVDALYGAWACCNNVTHIDKGINDVKLPQAWHNERIRSDLPGGAQFSMCDGLVHFLSESTDKKVIRALCSRDGEELLPETPF